MRFTTTVAFLTLVPYVFGFRLGLYQKKLSYRPTARSVAAAGPSQLTYFAQATTDTAFKLMLSPGLGCDKSVVISFLNAFIPAFRGDPVTDITEMPASSPALRSQGERQTFMDLHVVSNSGTHYIIEMQASRHLMFDERALFYACSTYSRQLEVKKLKEANWYHHLKAVIALQILNYDSNKIRGAISATGNSVGDTIFERVQAAPMEENQFIKHFLLTDQFSNQVIDYLQMVQVELPRAEHIKMLTPPRKDFTEQEWWLGILLHAHDYTPDAVEDMHSKGIIPEVIYKALMRLDLQKWNPGEVREYESDLVDFKNLATVFAVERAEGKIEGMIEGRMELILGMFNNKIPLEQIAAIANMSIEDVKTIIESGKSTESV